MGSRGASAEHSESVGAAVNVWLARIAVPLLVPFGLLVLVYWLLEDWIKGRLK